MIKRTELEKLQKNYVETLASLDELIKDIDKLTRRFKKKIKTEQFLSEQEKQRLRRNK